MTDFGAVLEAVKRAKRVFLCGNGGSAANALHITNDLVACGIKAHALVGDVATLTAIANDFGYQHVFSRQIKVLAERGDLVIALSGSGYSPNVLEAQQTARDVGAEFIMVTDFLRNMDMQQSEEAQIVLGHYLWRSLKKAPE